ncbi:hypothetical protein CAPTEDRAFT_19530 [Capitella teleta]|uniref:1-acyl-sn-glycerol-3-phosphate acyltransferase n=1 Tax=Capitella teleta TaxID=283909 RepID=R7V745_CAPTE|nr:hypothetical protein CAPTEDRAFT_19530 [Capitella teleta]|eukprot:ELU12181.1 hypothetical protein CAPTEDRAFT_19530 [Capitella teleta]
MALGWIELTLIGLATLFPIVWRASCSVRYYVKIFVYFSFMMLTGFVMIPIVMWRPKHPRNLMYVRNFWNFSLRMFQWEVEVRDRENVEYMKPAVIVSNHQSALDMIAMMQAMPERTTALAKKELLFTGAWGVTAWLCGLVFVDRLNPQRARDTMKKTVKYLQTSDMKLWVFPEGTRKLNGEINTFKKGAFHLAIEAQVPILPIVNSSYLPFYDPKTKKFNPGKIITVCLPAISTEGMTSDDVNQVTEDTRQKMAVVFEKISREVAQEIGSKET